MSNYCSAAINGLALNCQGNAGGIKRVWMALYEDNIFSGSTADSGNTISAVKTSGISWYEYAFRKNTGSMTGTLNVDAQAGTNFVETVLSLNFARMTAASRAEAVALALASVAIVVEDANGTCWALGEENPVEMTAGTGQTGQQRSDGNNYALELTDTSSGFVKPLTEEAKTAFIAAVSA